MSDIAISVSNVSKCYRVFDNQRSRLLHAVWTPHTKGMQEVWALKDINFEIKRGESVAIIGRNGGGKSTLLEILTGTLTPTTGSVKVNGRVSALLELGSGFNPEYSGRDNVVLNGLLLGLSKEAILSRFAEIEAFAEIGAAIDRPVKTYSSGMMMRLAFAVQVLCDPDILIIDEALSVGDFFFQQKCLLHIKNLCERGVTLLFVSHDMGTIRDICQRAIYLRKGEVSQDGGTLEVISRYLSDAQNVEMVARKVDDVGVPLLPKVKDVDEEYARIFSAPVWSSGDVAPSKEGKLVAIAIQGEDGLPCTTFKIGQHLTLLVAYISDLSTDCHVGLTIRNRFSEVICTLGTYFSKTALPTPSGQFSEKKLVVSESRIQMMLEAGQYSFEVTTGATTSVNRGILLDSAPSIGPITMVWDYENDIAPFLGRFGLPVNSSCYVLNS